MIHGWTSTMDEVGNLYRRLAGDLNLLGIASIRIQIPGGSRAASNRLTSTFNERVDAAAQGLQYLTDNCNQKPVGVLGFSLGGATALSLAGQAPEKIQSLVLWSSAINPTEVESYFTEEQKDHILEQGELEFSTYQTFIITKRHLLGLRGHNNIVQEFANYRGALLMLRGTEDFLPKHEQTIMKTSNAEPLKYHYIDGADHIFNVLDDDKDYDEILLTHTSQWLDKTLPSIP
jgi:alpha-beta hydrolase superfamily lysophospholipase